MLTGNEKIKDIENDDICNWLGNSLCAIGAERVRIVDENNHLGKYRVLYVKFKNYETRIALIGKRATNSTIQEIRNLILMGVGHQQKKRDKKQCKYRFQDKDKFDGQPYCTFFNEYCKYLSYICDKNCEVFELHKRIEVLENELKISQNQYFQVVQQNKNLQSDLRRFQSAIDEIEDFTEPIYEHIPEDKVLRQILNIVSEVKYPKESEE